MSPAITIRSMKASDIAFIAQSWLRTYRFSSTFARDIPDNVYFPLHRLVIQGILDRGTTRTLVACDLEDPNVMLGYIVVESQAVPTLHFWYVKKSFRRLGVGGVLFSKAGLREAGSGQYTHRTRLVDALATEVLGTWEYNPYAI